MQRAADKDLAFRMYVWSSRIAAFFWLYFVSATAFAAADLSRNENSATAQTKANSSTAEPITVYLNWQHQFEFAGYYAAQQQGYFDEAGLSVSLKAYESGSNITDLVTSAPARYGITDNRVILSYLEGRPVVLLASLFKRSPHIIVTQPDIQTPSQLKGKLIMAMPGELETAGMMTMLRQFYVSNEDFKTVPHDNKIDAFASGEVDAMTAFSSNQLFDLDRRHIAYNVLDPSRYTGELYSGNLFTSETEVREHPERVQKFTQAVLRGWQYALDHPKEIVQLIRSQYNNAKSVEALTYEADKIRDAIRPSVYPIGSVELERLRQIASIYIEHDYHVNRMNVAGILLQPSEIALSVLGLTAVELAFLKQNPVLNVHNEENWPPINFAVNGKPSGYSIEFMDLLASKLGIRINYITGNDWNAFMQMLSDGRLDIMLNIVETPERLKNFIFTPPYLSATTGIYVQGGSKNVAIRSLDELAGKTVAVPAGFFLNEQLKRYYPAIKVKNYTDSIKSLEAVASGDVDAMVGRSGVINFLIEKQFLSNIVMSTAVEDPRFTSEMHLAVNKDQPVLRDILSKVISNVTESETTALRRKWSQSGFVKQTSLTNAEQEYLLTREPVRVCIDPGWMPFEGFDLDGQFIGMESDYFMLFERFLRLPFEIVKTGSWTETLEYAKDRRCDLVSLIVETKKSAAFLDFTAPYLSYPYVIATRQEQLFVEDVKQVLEERVGIVRGYALYEDFSRRYPDTEWVEVDNVQDGLLKVQSGEIFGLIDSVPSIGYAMSELGLTDIRITGKIEGQRLLRTGVRNDDPLLLSIMQKAVASLDTDDHQDIRRRWSPINVQSKEDYTLTIWVFGISFLLLSFMLYRQITLRRYNRRIQEAFDDKEAANLALIEKTALLEKISITDPLTQVYNRLKINTLLQHELQRVRRYGGTFSVLLLDLDHFKIVNDTYGHPVGDQVLKTVVKVIQDGLRSTDSLGRWGGEEFMVICPETNLRSAMLVAENIRRQIARTLFVEVKHQFVSVGVTMHQPGDTLEAMVMRADDALYQAKDAGRDRVASVPKI